MFHIINFDGGLGNQMFQYAFYLSLKRRMWWALIGINPNGCKSHHNGLEIDRVFDFSTVRQIKYAIILCKLKRHGMVRFKECFEKSFFLYQPELLEIKWKPTCYEGFFQSEKYFLSIDKIIKESFVFNEELLNESTRKLSQILKNSKNTFSLHIRRGDYTTIEDTKTYGIDYYSRAYRYLADNVLDDKGKGFVFSDDILWAKNNLNLDADMTFIDWNTGENSWQDMYLMSLCKHNIIANSTFSWWGAWLNSNPRKVVVAPLKWMTYDNGKADIIPECWIKL